MSNSRGTPESTCSKRPGTRSPLLAAVLGHSARQAQCVSLDELSREGTRCFELVLSKMSSLDKEQLRAGLRRALWPRLCLESREEGEAVRAGFAGPRAQGKSGFG